MDIKLCIVTIISLLGLADLEYNTAKTMLLNDLDDFGIVSVLYPKHYMTAPKHIRTIFKIQQKEIPKYACVAFYYLLWKIAAALLYSLAILISKFNPYVAGVLFYFWLWPIVFLFPIHLCFHFYFKHKKRQADIISAKDVKQSSSLSDERRGSKKRKSSKRK